MPDLRGSHGDQPDHILTRWFGTPDLHRLDVYSGKPGGYAALRKALLDMAPAEITNEVKASGITATDSSTAYQVGAGSRFFFGKSKKTAFRVDLSMIQESTFNETNTHTNVAAGFSWKLGSH